MGLRLKQFQSLIKLQMKNRPYISTLCFSGIPISKIVKMAKLNDFKIEFSSGLPYNKSNIEFFDKFNVSSKLIHNYFPAPKNPFVINLASSNKKIRDLSINHCLKNIELSAKNNLNFYAAHAGFCVDPLPDNLGRFIQIKKPFNRAAHIDIFLNSLNQLINFAESLKVNFYIENNVVSKLNYTNNGNTNSFICCDSDEINYVFSQIKSEYFGLLLDTAHLKVSSSTLSLDMYDEVNKIIPTIRAIHHSDNDGLIDSNHPLDSNYWFLKFKEYFHLWQHVIEVKNIEIDKIKEQMSILN